DTSETHGINDRVQLSSAERELRRRINRDWMSRGVTFVDPANSYVDATVTLGRDVTVYPGVILQGQCDVGDGADIGPGTHLVDTSVGARAELRQTVAMGATIGSDARVGPWASLGPGDEVPSG